MRKNGPRCRLDREKYILKYSKNISKDIKHYQGLKVSKIRVLCCRLKLIDLFSTYLIFSNQNIIYI